VHRSQSSPRCILQHSLPKWQLSVLVFQRNLDFLSSACHPQFNTNSWLYPREFFYHASAVSPPFLDKKDTGSRAKRKVLPGIEPGSPGCPTLRAVMSIRTGSDNRYTIKPFLRWWNHSCFDYITTRRDRCVDKDNEGWQIKATLIH
jgi:hypothetical protein